jgi:tripartite ATP-independent transporter DctM subunit
MSVKSLFRKSENALAGIVILLLALFPTMEVIARKFFKTGIPNSTFYTQHLVFLLTFIAAMITAREKKHLSLSLDMAMPERVRRIAHVFVGFLSMMVTTALTVSSISFVLTAFDDQFSVWIIPGRLFMSIMAVSFMVMAVRFLEPLPNRAIKLMAAAIGLVLGLIVSSPSWADIFVGLGMGVPAQIQTLIDALAPFLPQMALFLIGLLLLSSIFGTPIFILMGGIAFLLFIRDGSGGGIIPNEAYSMLIDNSIPAIPLFAIAGFILSESKAGERLVRLFRSLFGWFPGGLAIMAILVSTFFTTFTGASGVTILALGALLSVVLIKGNYGKSFGYGLLTSSGSVGLLFPPSLPIIIYGISAQVSIKDMFLGGIIPGIIMVMALVIFAMVYAKRKKIPTEAFNLKDALISIKDSIWEILLPLVIILSYFGGLTTLVESSAIAVVYTLIVQLFIKRDLKAKNLMSVVNKAVPIIGGVLIILAVAKGLSYFIVDAQIPMKLSEWVGANISSKLTFLLLLNLALLITGCLMDIFSAIIVVVPLILPLGAHFGIDPVHLGIIFLANMELGYLTPPVGLNLFLASYRFNEPLAKIYRYVIPFLIIQMISVLIITYVPVFSTGLLNWLK